MREGKRTLLIARAFGKADPGQREVLAKNFGRSDVDATGIAAVQDVLRDTGALAAVETVIAELTTAARGALKHAPIEDRRGARGPARASPTAPPSARTDPGAACSPGTAGLAGELSAGAGRARGGRCRSDLARAAAPRTAHRARSPPGRRTRSSATSNTRRSARASGAQPSQSTTTPAPSGRADVGQGVRQGVEVVTDPLGKREGLLADVEEAGLVLDLPGVERDEPPSRMLGGVLDACARRPHSSSGRRRGRCVRPAVGPVRSWQRSSRTDS